jgi:predicted transposase/invertase (TIGR01784 family)
MRDEDTTGSRVRKNCSHGSVEGRTQKCDPSTLAELIPEEFVEKVPEVHEALEELKVLSADDEFRAEYNAHIKAQNDMRSRETNAEARGKAEGIAIGKREIALDAIKMGLPLEQISKLTGFSVNELQSLKS